MRIIVGAIAATVCIMGCATVAKVTLEDRFQAIGIPAGTAGCMVADLDTRLSSEDLQDLARYSINVARQNSTLSAVRALMEINNPRAVTAIGKSAAGCVSGFRL